MADWVLLGAALAAGFVLGVLVILPLRMRRRKGALASPAPRTIVPRDEVVPLEIVSDDEPPAPTPQPTFRAPAQAPHAATPEGAEWAEEHFTIAKKPTTPEPLPREAGGIPTEWARRVAGTIEPGRVKGICSGCGTKLSVTMQRPLRIACPVCGRTRLLP